METRSVRLSQVFSKQLEILVAPPTSLSALLYPIPPSLGEQEPDPTDLWIRAGPEEGDAGGTLEGLRWIPKGGKLRTSYRHPTWVSKEIIMSGTFPRPWLTQPCDLQDAPSPFIGWAPAPPPSSPAKLLPPSGSSQFLLRGSPGLAISKVSSYRRPSLIFWRVNSSISLPYLFPFDP